MKKQFSGRRAADMRRRHLVDSAKRESAQLFQILRLPLGNALSGCPGSDIGGCVYVDEHWDGMENYQFFSVNHASDHGGWQSGRIYTKQDAELGAEILAEFCGAKLVQR